MVLNAATPPWPGAFALSGMTGLLSAAMLPVLGGRLRCACGKLRRQSFQRGDRHQQAPADTHHRNEAPIGVGVALRLAEAEGALACGRDRDKRRVGHVCSSLAGAVRVRRRLSTPYRPSAGAKIGAGVW